MDSKQSLELAIVGVGLVTAILSLLTAWIGFRREVNFNRAVAPPSSEPKPPPGASLPAAPDGFAPSTKPERDAGEQRREAPISAVSWRRVLYAVSLCSFLVAVYFGISLVNSGVIQSLPQLVSDAVQQSDREWNQASWEGTATLNAQPIDAATLHLKSQSGESLATQIRHGDFSLPRIVAGTYEVTVKLGGDAPGVPALEFNAGTFEIEPGTNRDPIILHRDTRAPGRGLSRPQDQPGAGTSDAKPM